MAHKAAALARCRNFRRGYSVISVPPWKFAAKQLTQIKEISPIYQSNDRYALRLQEHRARWRQLAMQAVIAAMIVVALSPHAKDVIAEWLASAIRIVDAETIKRLVPSLMFLIFVLVSEKFGISLIASTRSWRSVIIRGLEEDYSIAPDLT